MTDRYTRLRVTQVGGFAGNVPMPPLIDLDRRLLDEAGAALMDAAGAQLAAARQAAARQAGAKAGPGAEAGVGGDQIGADLSGYRVEIEDESNHRAAFSLPGPGAGLGGGSSLEAAADVPQVLAPLVSLPQAQG